MYIKSGIRVVLLMLITISAQSQSLTHFSINNFLGNSARSDVMGPLMWNIMDNDAMATKPTFQPDAGYKGNRASQMPENAWRLPELGLTGIWCYGHHTNLSDVLSVRISAENASGKHELKLTPTRNNWTPAGIKTWFRSVYNEKVDEYKYAGMLNIIEQKCITSNNVFVAEITFIQDNRTAATYTLEATLPKFEKLNDSIFNVKAETMPGTLFKKYPVAGKAALICTESASTVRISLKPNERKTIRIAFAVDPSQQSIAAANAREAMKNPTVFDDNAAAFDKWFATNVPALSIANVDLLKMYYYRWFLVKRAWHNPKDVIPGHQYEFPAFYESPHGVWYGGVVGLSVPLQMEESKWLSNPYPAKAHALNWKKAGADYRNYIQSTPMAIWHLYQNHPDKAFIAEMYEESKKYTLNELQDQTGNTLPVQTGSWMTGAEYQPNFYQFSDTGWDWRNDLEGKKKWGRELARVVRLDRVTYAIANLKACAEMARELGKTDDAKMLNQLAEKIHNLLVSKLWDPKTRMFYAADPKTGKLATEAAGFDSFMPFMWGIVNDNRYFSAFEKLFDPALFWSEFPGTTVSMQCPMYWSGNCIAGPTASSIAEPHLYDCSWNGPVWNFSNGFIAEGLGAAALSSGNKQFQAKWLEFFDKWTEMQFLYGDHSVPCTLEHHRPTDGAWFTPIIDYFHSSWIDPFMKYYIGIRIDAGGQVTMSPFSQEAFELTNVRIQDKTYTFSQKIVNGKLTRRITTQ